MLIGFHLGTSLVPNSMVSIISPMDGLGGHINVFCAMNSLSISFCIVPPIVDLLIPLFSAMAIYIAQRTGAGGFTVMEVVILSMGRPSNSISISLNVSMATPHLPLSPLDLGESVSYPIRVGISNAVERPV